MTPAEANPAPTRPILGRIGAVLKVIRILIDHARTFAANARTIAAAPEFAPAAAVFGTYDVPLILLRLQRGMLRALALQRYLLARAAKGRNLRFPWPQRADLLPHHRPPAQPAHVQPASAKRAAPARLRQREPALLRDDDPRAYYLPTPDELDAEVRRRPIGRTISYICLDLGIRPCFCDGIFWNRLDRVLRYYGGTLERLYHLETERLETFQAERDRRPDTWHISWRGESRSALRQTFGYMIGETAPADALMPIVPS